ncbi:MAG: lytic transglycosylase domain-containing protein [Candidatus Rifleibacteriota bacterium]
MKMLENMRKVQQRVDQLKKSCGKFVTRKHTPPEKTFASEMAKASGKTDKADETSKTEKVLKPSQELITDIDNLVEKHAKENELEPELVRKLIATASGFNPDAVGTQGHLGLMQVKPEIFRQFGFTNPFDPDQNISAGTQHLSQMLKRNGNDLPRALAAYNTDSASVKRFGGVPPYPETKSFVSQILSELGKSE